MKPGSARNTARNKRRRAAHRLAVSIITAQLLLSGCAAPRPASSTATLPAPTRTPVPTAQVVATATSIPTATAAATSTPAAPTAPQASFAVCSPLDGIALEELGQPDLLKNPFQMPRPGMDDGHHGADFAYWTRGERTSMQGLPIYSVLTGRVAGVIHNRIPYGNAVIVETPLETLPEQFLHTLAAPLPAPTVPAAASLNCPPDPQPYQTSGAQSLYLLYAHMDQPPTIAVGDAVTCGDKLGEVGTTGKSVNYHLHLEVRAGPAGTTFQTAITHYDTAATAAEMAAYCTWRVSGLFQMLDPMNLFP